MCECYQIGGRFIAEDPDCPVHGTTAQAERERRDDLVSHCENVLTHGTQQEINIAFDRMLNYLRGL